VYHGSENIVKYELIERDEYGRTFEVDVESVNDVCDSKTIRVAN